MATFMEELLSRKFNFSQEILSIDELFHNSPNRYSLYDIADEKFINWKHRNNYISIDQLFLNTKINSILRNATANISDINDFIYYAECILNIMRHIRNDIENHYCDLCNNYNAVITNVENVIAASNYEIKYLKSKDYSIIVPSKWKINESINIIKDEYSLGEKMLSYYHYSMSGNIHEKVDILCRFYKVFESRYEKKLKANNYSALASDIGFLFDKLDIRHSPNKQEQKLLTNMSKEELEKWYDKLFDLCLDMLILCEHIDIRKEIDDLKSKLK